jgi:hypothetical protein
MEEKDSEVEEHGVWSRAKVDESRECHEIICYQFLASLPYPYPGTGPTTANHSSLPTSFI